MPKKSAATSRSNAIRGVAQNAASPREDRAERERAERERAERERAGQDHAGQTPTSLIQSFSDAELGTELLRRLPEWYAAHSREQIRAAQNGRSEHPTTLSAFAQGLSEKAAAARISPAALIGRGQAAAELLSSPEYRLSALAGHPLSSHRLTSISPPGLIVSLESKREQPSRRDWLLIQRGAGPDVRALFGEYGTSRRDWLLIQRGAGPDVRALFGEYGTSRRDWLLIQRGAGPDVRALFGEYGTRQARERALEDGGVLIKALREKAYFESLMVIADDIQARSRRGTKPAPGKDWRLITEARKLTGELRGAWKDAGGPTKQAARPGWELEWEQRRAEAADRLRKSLGSPLLGGDVEASLALLNVMGRVGLSTREHHEKLRQEAEKIRLTQRFGQPADNPRQVTRRLWVRPRWDDHDWHLSVAAGLTVRTD